MKPSQREYQTTELKVFAALIVVWLYGHFTGTDVSPIMEAVAPEQAAALSDAKAQVLAIALKYKTAAGSSNNLLLLLAAFYYGMKKFEKIAAIIKPSISGNKGE